MMLESVISHLRLSFLCLGEREPGVDVASTASLYQVIPAYLGFARDL